jgi:choline dehydrogenase-like flavoprotein
MSNTPLDTCLAEDPTFVELPFDTSAMRTNIRQLSPPTRFGNVYRDAIVQSPNIHLKKETRSACHGCNWSWHHMGTTRMDPDPKQGVVDANHKIHGLANVHVAGWAVFPTAGAANPTLTLLAMTLRLSDRLKGMV